MASCTCETRRLFRMCRCPRHMSVGYITHMQLCHNNNLMWTNLNYECSLLPVMTIMTSSATWEFGTIYCTNAMCQVRVSSVTYFVSRAEYLRTLLLKVKRMRTRSFFPVHEGLRTSLFTVAETFLRISAECIMQHALRNCPIEKKCPVNRLWKQKINPVGWEFHLYNKVKKVEQSLWRWLRIFRWGGLVISDCLMIHL